MQLPLHVHAPCHACGFAGFAVALCFCLALSAAAMTALLCSAFAFVCLHAVLIGLVRCARDGRAVL